MNQTLKLGRLVEFDERSRAFPIRTLVAKKTPRTFIWPCPLYLDQGNSSACVGFSWSHALATAPALNTGITNQTGFNIYRRAQVLDQWPGEKYDGTSVLAGIKAVTELFPGAIESYRWAFNLQDLILSVGYYGSVVIGINWYSNMFTPDAKGVVRVGGTIQGGHATLVRGVNISIEYFILKNTWGKSWGLNGDYLISFKDMERLLGERGEACIPVRRHHIAIV